jgi:phage head maturation protease
VLREIDLYEASPVSVPANRQADITAVKSFLEAGRADKEQRQQEARQAYARFQQTRFRFTFSKGE